MSVNVVTSADCERLADRGWLKVTGLIPDELIEPVRECIRERLRAADEERARAVLKNLAKSNMLEPMVTAEVLARAEALCGNRTLQPTLRHCQLLHTPPFSHVTASDPVERWSVPRNVWHTDFPLDGDAAGYGVQIFTFIDEVEVRGGGTLLAAGSHRLRRGRVLSSRAFKRSLRGEVFWQKLTDKKLSERGRMRDFDGEVEGVPLQLVELSGKPGDVYFTDLRLLHALAPNTQPRPRLMMTQRYLTAEGRQRLNRVQALK